MSPTDKPFVKLLIIRGKKITLALRTTQGCGPYIEDCIRDCLWKKYFRHREYPAEENKLIKRAHRGNVSFTLGLKKREREGGDSESEGDDVVFAQLTAFEGGLEMEPVFFHSSQSAISQLTLPLQQAAEWKGMQQTELRHRQLTATTTLGSAGLFR